MLLHCSSVAVGVTRNVYTSVRDWNQPMEPFLMVGCRIKADMEQMVESMDIEWEQKSTETIQLQERLKAVHLLVNKFGLDTHNN